MNHFIFYFSQAIVCQKNRKDGRGMPTDRFYHLPKEKKKLIKEAAIKEFCRVPIEKASINKIVQNAEISRGSFYTYFYDKEDILEYIFEDVIIQIQSFCKQVLIEEKGEFWALPPKLLDYTLQVCETNKMFSLVQSTTGNRIIGALLDGKPSFGSCCSLKMTRKPKNDSQVLILPDVDFGSGGIGVWVKELYQLTDCSKLKVESFEDFQAVFSLCVMNMMSAIGGIYQKGEDEKEAKRLFAKRLELIKYGGAINDS